MLCLCLTWAFCGLSVPLNCHRFALVFFVIYPHR
nr:MAG TPA: hypothetical protein [Caudoviricetes sp.]